MLVARGARAHRLGERGELAVELRAHPAPREQARGETVDHLAQVHDLERVARVERHHGRRAARRDRDEALALERDERLAQRRPADVQPAREMLLAQHGSRRELAFEDRASHGVDDAFLHARVAHGRDRRHLVEILAHAPHRGASASSAAISALSDSFATRIVGVSGNASRNSTRAGILYGARRVAQNCAQLRFADRRARRANDARDDVFLRQRRRNADDRCLLHARMERERVLHLARRDVLAAPADHLLVAPDKHHVAVSVDVARVAGAQPAALQRALRDLRRLPIARRHGGVAKLQLADRSARRQLACGRDDAQLVGDQTVRMAARRADARALGARRRRLDAAERALRHPEAGDDAHAEPRFERAVLLRLEHRRGVDRPQRAAHEHLGGLAREDREHRADEVDLGHTELRGVAPERRTR